MAGRQVVGWVTSGGYGHCVGSSIALGYVPAGSAVADAHFEIEILGERRAATLVSRPLYERTGIGCGGSSRILRNRGKNADARCLEGTGGPRRCR